VRAIIGQQVSVAGATTLMTRLVDACGDDITGFESLGLTRIFPTPATIAAADLRDIGLTSARAAAVLSFAGAVADGKVRLDASIGLDELVAALCELPGIGPWTAHYIAMRACGEPDAFPAGDLGLRRSAAGDGVRPSERDLLARAEAWRPWRAYAAMHLWSALGAAQSSDRGRRSASVG
jgi:AraC family transcriptional regulator of adaptative response / DNA-3-methyladenine glycosylase II